MILRHLQKLTTCPWLKFAGSSARLSISKQGAKVERTLRGILLQLVCSVTESGTSVSVPYRPISTVITFGIESQRGVGTSSINEVGAWMAKANQKAKSPTGRLG